MDIMPGYCQTFFDFFKVRAPSSSTGHRNTQRLNAGLQISTDFLQPFGPAVITTKAAQTLVSAHAVLREDTHNAEKLLHGLQALLALSQVGLAITLYAQNNSCSEMNPLCKAAYICELVYQGILLTGWGASELSKDTPALPAPAAIGP